MVKVNPMNLVMDFICALYVSDVIETLTFFYFICLRCVRRGYCMKQDKKHEKNLTISV